MALAAGPLLLAERGSTLDLAGMTVRRTPIGGLLAGWWGLTAPFWFAFAGSVLILVLVWRALAGITGDPTLVSANPTR